MTTIVMETKKIKVPTWLNLYETNCQILQGPTKLTKDTSNVEIIESDLVRMRGKVLRIDGSTVKVTPTNTDDFGWYC